MPEVCPFYILGLVLTAEPWESEYWYRGRLQYDQKGMLTVWVSLRKQQNSYSGT